MCPAQGHNQLLTLQRQAFVGTVAVTHQHDCDQVCASLAPMPLGNVCPAPRSPLLIHHRGRLHPPQRPAMPRFAVALFQDLPACCIAMEALCCPLPLVEHRHQRRTQHLEAWQAIGDCALGQRDTVMRQLLTSAVGGTAREICVQQHHRPYGHPQGALRDDTRYWRRRHKTWALGTPTRRVVAGPLHTSHVGLYRSCDAIASFATRKRCQRLATLRTVFGCLAHVVHFHHHRQRGTITAAVSRCARLLAPLARLDRIDLPERLGSSGCLAFRPIEALGEIASLRFKGFYLRLQRRFALHQACVLGPPGVRFPRECDIVLLCQHH
jgi:hypothetical protein